MKIKLLINGEDKRIFIKPENNSDRKLLEFVSEHNIAEVKVNRPYSYGLREIESIELLLKTASEEKSD